MAKTYMDWNQWVDESGLSEEDIEKAYKKVKFRRNLYGILTFLTPLGIILAPFWYKALYLTKAFRYRSFNVEPNKLAAIVFGLYMIGTLFIYPLVMLKIITKTNWGMGLKNL